MKNMKDKGMSYMKLFENGVGRPSNEILRKRRMFYYGVVGCIVMLLTVGVLTLEHFNVINLMGASSTNKCVFPYKNINCSGTKNNTVKKAQELLKKQGFYKDKSDGYFGPKTKAAVVNFQKKYKLESNGTMNVETLRKLAQLTRTNYYLIRYSKNGGTGTLSSTMEYNKYPTQFVFYGVKENVSSTRLSKNGYTHVGWYASSNIAKRVHNFGCSSKNCTDSSKYIKWISQIKKTKVNSYMIDPSMSTLNFERIKPDVIVTLTAQYCKSGEKFDKSKSSCVAAPKTTTTTQPLSNGSSGGSYVKPTGKENGVDRYTIFVASVCQEDATGYTGAKWVIDTIFNRVDDKVGDFKKQKTPWAVLTAKNQFSAYYDRDYTRRLSNGKLKSECNQAKKAVDDAFANPKNRAHNYLFFLASRKYSSDVKVGDNYYRAKY